MKIYTKTGDNGSTSLFGGTRVPKNHLRVDTYGTIDELNSYIGLIRDQDISTYLIDVLIKIQKDLFTVGAMVATAPEKEILKNGKQRLSISTIEDHHIRYLEEKIDEMEAILPQMTHFILPGGHTTVSYCHISRTICRRAERLAVALNDKETLNPTIITYLNRLSDFLFVLARKLTHDLKAEEIKWIP